jgi:lysyl-tRNA synthetase class 2
LGESDYPIDTEFIASVSAMGPAAGVALGIDRLVMALLGVREISDVRVCG